MKALILSPIGKTGKKIMGEKKKKKRMDFCEISQNFCDPEKLLRDLTKLSRYLSCKVSQDHLRSGSVRLKGMKTNTDTNMEWEKFIEF